MSATESLSPTQTAPNVVQYKYPLDVLNITQTARVQFGLRTEDYKMYRGYCAKKLERLRRQLRKQYGKKQFQNKITDPSQVKDVRYLLIILFKAERAWAYAMDLKKEYEQDNASQRTGLHMQRRFAKANLHATQFELICQQVCNPISIIEAKAYASWLRSTFLIQKERWSEALQQINISKAIYEELEKSGDHTLKELYQKRLEESEPIFRFCLYNLKHSQDGSGKVGTNSDPQLVKEIKEAVASLSSDSTSSSSDKPMSTVTWKSKVIKIDNEKLREKLVIYQQFKSNDFESASKQPLLKRLQSYEKIISHLISCELLIKNDVLNLERINSKHKTVKTEYEEITKKMLLSFVLYHKMKYLYERNEILIGLFLKSINGDQLTEEENNALKKKKKITTKDLVRMYSHQVKIYTTLSQHIDLTSSSSAMSSKDHDSQILLLKSRRLYYIADYLATSKKFAETIALLDRITNTNFVQIKKNTKNQTILSETQKLEDLIKKLKSQIHANHFLQQLSTNEEFKSQMNNLSIQGEKSSDLLSGLDNYDSSFLAEKKLVDYPPPLEPVSVKPLFFDLAFNSVQFPSLEARKKAASKGGLFGFWGRG
eukprot:gene5814-7232_t